MFDGACNKKCRDSLVAVRDAGKTVLFENKRRVQFDVVRFDDCVVKRGSLAADYVVREPDVGTIIVELKGIDIVHGAKQICATAEHCKKNGIDLGQVAGLVVGRQKPASARAFLKISREFYRSNGAFIRASSQNQHAITNVMDHKQSI